MELWIVLGILGSLILLAVGGEIRVAYLKKRAATDARSIEARPDHTPEDTQPPVDTPSIKVRLTQLGFLFHQFKPPGSTYYCVCYKFLYVIYGSGVAPLKGIVGVYCVACGKGCTGIREDPVQLPSDYAERKTNWALWGNLLALLPCWENGEQTTDPPQQGKLHLHIVK